MTGLLPLALALSLANPDPSVLEGRNGSARQGMYVAPGLTRLSVGQLHRDPAFKASLRGPTYAQPLYVERGGSTPPMLIAATEQDLVYAFDARTGAVLWQRSLGSPAPRRSMPCGNIDPLGITGTPVVDPATGTLYLDAMQLDGKVPRHYLYALSLADGGTQPGWPIDLDRVAHDGETHFQSSLQNQRGGLLLVNGTLYAAYGGHFGDCGDYHGWLIGVPVAEPQKLRAWATPGRGGGIWSPGGPASDGHFIYAATGNSFGGPPWHGGEAILRFDPGPHFREGPTAFFLPADWERLDDRDLDIAGTGPVLFNFGSPAHGVGMVFGKSGEGFLFDAQNLGGMGHSLLTETLSPSQFITAPAVYQTSGGTYLALQGKPLHCPKGQSGNLLAVELRDPEKPTLSVAWCAHQNGRGSPIVTTLDGHTEPIVWGLGAEGDNRLRAFDGESGKPLFEGGGAKEAMAHLRRFQSPIAVGNRIFVAGDDEIYAFTTQPGKQ